VTPERWQSVKLLLNEILELPRELRSAHAERVTRTHPELREEIESLLAANDDAGSDFLEKPAAASAWPQVDPLIGRRIGPYLIVGEIGSGGMADVYRAVRDDQQFRQDVAIKLVRGAARSPLHIVRFLQERQILAALSHPNIARLLDGGTTEDGVPYFVMERIEGVPLTDYCDAHGLDTPARLSLFLEVCAAVHSAHQHLVVHRDLKPSNVLVTADGTPKLLDFGIAKILEPQAALAARDATVSMMRVFTPNYASPEQLRGETVTTASDIYSLGVMLYELLTGSRPYELVGRRSDELAPIVTQTRPARPSVAARASSPQKRIARDLDNIVLMTLRADPARRYGSVESLARDIRDHLEHRPVAARGDALGYVLSRFVLRHRLAVGAAAAALAATLAAGALLVRATQVAERERNAAEMALAGQYAERAWDALHDGYRLQAARYALAAASLVPPGRTGFHAVLAAQLYQPEALVLHQDSGLQEASFSRDGARVLTVASDGGAAIWDARTGRQLARMRHGRTIWRGFFSPDGERVVTASDDRTARIWDSRGKELNRLVHGDRVEYAEFSPDGRLVVTASIDRTARIWDASSGRELLRLPHEAGVWSARFSPDGARVVTASADKTARVFDARTGRELLKLVHGGAVSDARFSPDAKLIATASRDQSARIWDARTGGLLERLPHGNTVWTARFSPDAARLVTASDDDTARIWSVASGRELARLQHAQQVDCAVFSPDGREVVTASRNTLRVWDAATGHELERLQHDAAIWGVPVFSPDGSRLLSVSNDGTARIWRLHTGAERARLNHDQYVDAAVFTPDGARIVTASWDGTARVWDARSELLRLSHDDRVADVAVSPDGRLIATASMGGAAYLWDGATGRALAHLAHGAGLWRVVFSPDGMRVVTTSMDKTARIWDVASAREIAQLRHDGPVRAAAFSPDGARVATTSDDGTARLWDAASGRLLLELRHRDAVWSVAFSPDGARILTGSYDKSAVLWDARTGAKLGTVRHDGRVLAARFSPDGHRIVTASADHSARVWDARSGALLARLPHEDAVTSAVFSPDGTEVATASDDGTVRVWDAVTSVELVRFQHDFRVDSVAFSAGGGRLVSASDDGTAREWRLSLARLDSSALARRACTLLEAATGEATSLPAVCSSGNAPAR